MNSTPMNKEGTSNCCLMTSSPFSVQRVGYNNGYRAAASLPKGTDYSTTDFDSVIAKDLAGLSLQERRTLSAEIDGVGCCQSYKAEPVEFVDSQLNAMEEALGTITGPSRSAYDLAKETNSNYVSSRKFRIMFLRSEKFDTHKAAQRMIRHFEYKRELFGDDKIAQDITYDDLSQDDRTCLKCGCFQLLGNNKDTMGRTVAFHFPALMEFVSWKNLVRRFLEC